MCDILGTDFEVKAERKFTASFWSLGASFGFRAQSLDKDIRLTLVSFVLAWIAIVFSPENVHQQSRFDFWIVAYVNSKIRSRPSVTVLDEKWSKFSPLDESANIVKEV